MTAIVCYIGRDAIQKGMVVAQERVVNNMSGGSFLDCIRSHVTRMPNVSEPDYPKCESDGSPIGAEVDGDDLFGDNDADKHIYDWPSTGLSIVPPLLPEKERKIQKVREEPIYATPNKISSKGGNKQPSEGSVNKVLATSDESMSPKHWSAWSPIRHGESNKTEAEIHTTCGQTLLHSTIKDDTIPTPESQHGSRHNARFNLRPRVVQPKRFQF